MTPPLFLIGLCLGLLPGLALATYGIPALTLSLLSETPYSVSQSLSEVPLIAIPSAELAVLTDTQEAMPAVRILLRRPILISAQESLVSFPAGLTLAGGEIPMRVAAIVAPTEQPLPVAVRVLYVLPAIPQPEYIYPPVYSYYHQYPVFYGSPNRKPVQAPQGIKRPTGTKVDRPLVTVLDFPSSIASPQVLYYQPAPNPDDELGPREPPQAIPPAGIVQSTAPIATQSVFHNAKESPFLETFRQESDDRQKLLRSSPEVDLIGDSEVVEAYLGPPIQRAFRRQATMGKPTTIIEPNDIETISTISSTSKKE